jgi:hypothetical protein
MKSTNCQGQLLVDTQLSLSVIGMQRNWYLNHALKKVLEYRYNKRGHNYQVIANHLLGNG